MVRISLLIHMILLAFVTNVEAQSEQLGELGLGEFLMQPSLVLDSRVESGFELGPSYVDFVWNKDNKYQAHIVFGDLNLLGVPQFVGVDTDGYGLISGFAEMQTSYGDVKAGLIPIQFGLEAGISESRLYFERSLIHEMRYLFIRDLGLQYFIEHNGFYTYSTVHNGEAGENTDNRYWFTTQFGFRGPAGADVGLSGSVGRYFPGVEEEHLRRAGNIHAKFSLRNLGAAVEATFGEDVLDGEKTPFLGWHADLRHPLFGSISILARFDHFDSDRDSGDSIIEKSTFGLAVDDLSYNSILYLYYHRRWDESSGQIDNQGLILWRLTSLFNDEK